MRQVLTVCLTFVTMISLVSLECSYGAPPTTKTGSKPVAAIKPVKPFLPGNRLPAIGDLGQLFSRRAKVVQVIDPNNAIVELEWFLEEFAFQSFNNGTSSGQSSQRRSTLKHEHVWLVFATEKMVAGQLFETDRIFEIKGTREFDVNGVKRLLLLLELADEEKIRAEGFRTWLSADGLLAMVAKLKETTGSKREKVVTFIRRDESTITVPFYLLSRADQDFIQESLVAVPVVVEVANGGQPGNDTAKKPQEAATSGNARVKWMNETDGTTVRRVKESVWEEVDNVTGKVKYELQETGRSAEFIEVLCPKRKITFRLLAQRMEQKKDGNWGRVADGRWFKADDAKDAAAIMQ